MSNSQDYSKNIKHNELFVQCLKDTDVKEYDDFSDWIIVGIFYSSLHYMNLFLSKRYDDINLETVKSHKDRNIIIQKKCPYQIHMAYRTLYELSREARYQCSDVSSKVRFVEQKYQELKNLCSEQMQRSASKR